MMKKLDLISIEKILFDCENQLMRWCLINKISFKKVKLLTALYF